MSNFERSLTEVLKSEGGYVNHPKDPGGETNKGITKRVYDDYRKRSGLSLQSVKYISDAEVSAIYKSSYWDLAKCSYLPSGVDYVVFDGAVNSGVSQSVKWLQRALGVKDDGIIGPTTIAAATKAESASLVDKICDNRLKFLKALKTWSTFGKGWGSRVAHVRSLGKKWAVGVTPVVTVGFLDQTSAKALETDVKSAPSTAIGDTTAGAGGAGLLISQTISQLTPFSNIEMIGKVVAVLTVVSAVLALGGLAYGYWSRQRQKKIDSVV